MSVQRAIEPDVRPVDRGLPRVGDRRERAPRQPFPNLPEPDGSKRKPVTDAEREAPDTERRIDIRVSGEMLPTRHDLPMSLSAPPLH